MKHEDPLLKIVHDLQRSGHKLIHYEAGQAAVTIPNGETTFALLRGGDWLHIASALVEAEDLKGSVYRHALGELALRAHARLLGCRLGYDEDGSLVLQADLYPDTQEAAHVAIVLGQMDYVGSRLLPLVEHTLSTGAIPDDEMFDKAFE